MEWLHMFMSRLRALRRRRRLEEEIEEELRFHLEMSGEAGRRRFGSQALVREEIRAAWTFHALETFWQDVRYGARMMARNKVFAAAAILSLALGVGANTSMFSLMLSVCFPTFPYRDAGRIIYLRAATPTDRWAWNTSLADFLDWRARSQTVSATIGVTEALFHAADDDGAPERLIGRRVTPNFLSFLGVSPAAGRDFRPDENQPGREKVAILGYGYWERRFGRKPEVIGRTIRLNRESYTVIGVVPPSFQWLRWRNIDCGDPVGEAEHCIDVYVPLVEQAAERAPRNVVVLGRARPGVGLDQVTAEMKTIAARLEREHPDTNRNWSVNPQYLTLAFFQMAPGLFVMQGTAFFVLLIACTNVASLLLARAAVRRREIAMRCALGAGRRRVIRQLLTEGLLLAAVASAAGFFVARWGERLAAWSVGQTFQFPLDRRALIFTAATAIVTALLFGLAPALEVSKTDPGEALKEGGRAAWLGRGRRRLRRALVAGQVALALVLLTGAGLMTKTFANLAAVRPGFDPHPILVARLPSESGPQQDRTGFFRQTLEAVRGVPGVAAASLASWPHLWGGERVRALDARGEWIERQVRYRAVTRDYLDTLGAPVIKGRDFSPSDRGARVALVNQPLAKTLWPGQEPVGRYVTLERNKQRLELLVIGVLPPLADGHVREAPRPQVIELSESPDASPWLVVRTHGRPAAIVPELRKAVLAVDASQPLAAVQTIDEAVERSIGEWKISRNLLVAFAGMALALAALGIYGILSYFVAQRRQEVGVRMALGAKTEDVFRLMLGDGLRLGAWGVGFGLMVAPALGFALAGALYGVQPLDVASYLAAAAAMFGVAALAALVPARRASRLEPSEALRHE